MLGEKIQESQGKVTSRRVLPGDDFRYIRVEITIEEEGTLLGQPGMNMGTYTTYERVPGQMYGEGQGIVASNDGESAIWRGHAIGRMGEGGAMTFRYSLAFQASPTGILAPLNSILLVGEHEVSASGETRTIGWEWK